MNNHKNSQQVTSVYNPHFLLKEQGNIKPDELYNIITFDNGSPDRLAIDLYSDIRSWYKPKKTTKEGNIVYISKLKSQFYKTSYSYLANKYRVSKETIRSKLVKLEDLGLLSRAFTTEKRYYDREENNVLNILVWKDTPYFQCSVGLEKTKELIDLCYKKISSENLPSSPNELGEDVRHEVVLKSCFR